MVRKSLLPYYTQENTEKKHTKRKKQAHTEKKKKHTHTQKKKIHKTTNEHRNMRKSYQTENKEFTWVRVRLIFKSG